ncbi:MAG: helix-hairpin-helix domain-containing protein [Ignavibacteriaceae bacterium]|jgi:competence protein ComEA|nr:helix-hairpin-helix domain-containing protein [Ignavibacteriaceae bacterium]MCU0364163.1 helix-hairpin-helix domain-containing protein [Ignavibacteriaceae bacterium]MCU0405807.1 helix-hairpin-helix domain-containing protein [Ignavibacteriaceae bacterium]MCU0412969.1 helix-hairpin-helix domain-containing protein [Ignavibacteriaceae bacterium]
MFEKLSKKIGFTETEILVILFLAGLFILGFVYVEFIKTDTAEFKHIDYAKQDSLFAYYSNLNPEFDIDDPGLDSNLAIKRRVLELSDTIAYVKKDLSTLAEKSININTAGVNDLIKLPGIGEKTAEKIIELRNQRGKFERLEDLMDVRGIGEVKFNKIKKFLYID